MSRKPCSRLEQESDDARRAVIYSLRGKLIGSAECYAFLDEVRDKIQDGYVNVVLDLHGVDWFNSTGVGIIASIYTSSHNQNGKLYMVGTPERICNLLKTVNLWQFVVPCDTMEDVHIDPAVTDG